MKLTKFFLALPITLFLIGCGKVTKPTTKSNSTTEGTTTGGTTTGGTTTGTPTTTGGGQPTTTNQVTTAHQSSTLNFFCSSSTIKDTLNDYYSNVDVIEATKTTLKDGTVINWVQIPGGNNTNTDQYLAGLNEGLDNNEVDMFSVELDYMYKYINSNYVADLSNVGVDFSKQFKFARDLGKNESGKICASSICFCPGMYAYNLNVAKEVWGNSITTEEIEDKLSTRTKLEAAAEEIKAVDGKYLLSGYSDLIFGYAYNLSSSMWDGDSLIVDKEFFRWAKDMKDYANKGYMKSKSDMYGLWMPDWIDEQGKDNVLLHVSAPWYNISTLPSFRYNNGEEDYDIQNMTDANMRLAKAYKPFTWGAMWICATKKAMNNDSTKDDVIDIIEKLTVDYDTISRYDFITKGQLVGNNVDVIEDMSKTDAGKLAYFGGQNVFKYALEAGNACDSCVYDSFAGLSTLDLFSFTFEGYFIRNEKTAEEAWSLCQNALCSKYNLPSYKVRIHPDVTLSGYTITIS